MKNKKKMLRTFVTLALLGMLFSCGQDKVDPALVLDDTFLPNGFEQADKLSSEALSRLEELRLDNPLDHFYYLKRIDTKATATQDWIFPQNDLKIEFVDYDENVKANSNPDVHGVIVKKIKGNWKDEVFMVVDGRPMPKGGMQQLYDYISANIKYPEQAKKSGIEGKVFVEFVVDQKGELTNIKTIKGIGSGCDEEAERVLTESPHWKPGLIGGKAGKVKMIIPITYKLG